MDKEKDKVRIYELAKELNTTSKRLMEKLDEINVHVKNHMSFLEDNELDALKKHIGLVKDEQKKPDHASRVEQVRKDKSAPVIIRKTQVVHEERQEDRRPQERQTMVTKQGMNSGLRSGYVTDPGVENRRRDQRQDSQDQRRDFRKDQPRTAEAPRAAAVQNETADHTAPVAAKTEEGPKMEVRQDNASVRPTAEERPARQETEVKNETEQRSAAPQQPERTSRPEGDRGPRPEGDRGPRPQGNYGDRGPRPEGGYGDRGPRPQGNYGDRGPRPEGGYGDRGPRPQGNYGDRGPRPEGGYGDRGPRPQGNYGDRGPRPEGDRGPRPQGNYGDRGPRPEGGYGDRGPRPQGNYGDRGPRPEGGYGDRGPRPQGNFGDRGPRPEGGYGDRGPRPQGNYGDRGPRPEGGFGDRGPRPQGNYGDRGPRPQGGGYGDRGPRPQGAGYGDRGPRPQGGGYGGPRPGGFGNKDGFDKDRDPRDQQTRSPRQGFRGGNRGVEMPKADLTQAQKEAEESKRRELAREFSVKDDAKEQKRDQKKETVAKRPVKAGPVKDAPAKIVLGEKRGVNEALSEDYILNEFYNDDGVKKKRRPRREEMRRPEPPKPVQTSIAVGESISVKELAEAMKKTSTEVIKKLMVLGIMATVNQEIDYDTAAIIAEEMGVKVEKMVEVNEEDILFDDADDSASETAVQRPPVVVVMGHVDHGKTSLLDAIRSENVTESEAGGITQHIGAYTVKIHDRAITFLDTPGHEAFTAMRQRGAQVTDIAILVVAADDGVMPQTIEAINHAKAAGVSIIVAINKIDKPGANPDRVKQELTEYGIVSEEWGGDAIMVPVSAKQRLNIDNLLEMVILAADMLELKADPARQAKGTVIEAKLDKNRGPVATVLVQRGTLNTGDSIVTGTTVGRIRAMTDDRGKTVKTAGPSIPVEILGLPEVPEAGEIFYAIEDEKVAKQLAEKRRLKLREQTLKASSRVTLNDLYSQIQEGKVKDINLIVKADVQGSVQAVKQSLEKLTNEEVRVRIIHGAVGAINESDVSLAAVTNAIIIGFNVRPNANVSVAAEKNGVDVRLYRVIYNAIEDVQAAMKGMLEPTYKEVVLGHAEVRQVFKVSNVGTIAGCYVTDGKIVRNSEVRIVRGGIVIHEGKLASLKRFKDDAKEVAYSYECGLNIEKFNDLKELDVIEAFIMEEVPR